MAGFGANHPCFCPDGGVGVVIGKLVSANLTVNLASGDLYADDSLAEQLSEFANGAIAMETDDMIDANASVVYGAKVSNGVVVYNTSDTAPRGVLAYYKALMRNGIKSYKGYCYPRARAALGNDNAATRAGSITFQTTTTNFTIFADDVGNWRETKEFGTVADAKAWCEVKCSVGDYFEVNVSVQGAGVGEGVDVEGTVFVAAKSDFVLNITGHASVTAAYDNGTAVTAAITGGAGKYTLSSVNANHTIAIVF